MVSPPLRTGVSLQRSQGCLHHLQGTLEGICVLHQTGHSLRAGAGSPGLKPHPELLVAAPLPSDYAASSIEARAPSLRLRVGRGLGCPLRLAGSLAPGPAWSQCLGISLLSHSAFGILFAEHGSRCQQQLCACDQKFVYCLKRNMRELQPSLSVLSQLPSAPLVASKRAPSWARKLAPPATTPDSPAPLASQGGSRSGVSMVPLGLEEPHTTLHPPEGSRGE